ncbi:hypothetical protein MXB_1699, partial [Myxobolus squamalis]
MPGLLYKSPEESTREEMWSCCWMTVGQEDLFLASGFSESISISKLFEGELKEDFPITVPNSIAVFHINSHPTKPCTYYSNLQGSLQLESMGSHPLVSFVWSSFFSQCGRRLCLPSVEQGTLIIRDLQDNPENIIFTAKTTHITAACMHPTKELVACCNSEGVIEVFDIPTSKLVYMMEGHAMPIRSIKYSPDGNFLVTASQDALIKIYDGHNSTFIGALSGHTSWVTSLCFNPQSNTSFLSSSLDGSVKLWDIENRTCVETMANHKRGVWEVKY